MGAKQLTPWQTAAAAQFDAAAAALPDDLQVLEVQRREELLEVRVRLRTADIPETTGGLRLRPHEEFLIRVRPHPLSPPDVEVDHDRFLGFPHVLQGHRICIYLDPSREWDPRQGAASCLDRLQDWLLNAAAGRFDARTALFHAVGGVVHHALGAPTIVVREPVTNQHTHAATMVRRTNQRLDLHRRKTETDQHQAFVMPLAAPLPLGAGSKLGHLLIALDGVMRKDQARHVTPHPPQSAAFLTALAAAASRNSRGTSQRFVLAVPHPTGGPPHLLAGCLPGAAADQLRDAVADRSHPLITVAPAGVDSNTVVEWYRVSDEREEVNTRRDDSRPTSAYLGKTVQVWGCGGLGSWIAEFLVRAGVKRISVCDPGVVGGGLLVRQDFTEIDIGRNKADALADRLRALRDDIDVEAHAEAVPPTLEDGVDLIIDATVSIAIGQFLDQLAKSKHRPLLAQVATDARTATLGLLTVSANGMPGPFSIDEATASLVRSRSDLESFHMFWQETESGDELIPTRGCSVPTFHGSAADLAAVAGSLLTLLAGHVGAEPVSGSHLVALPHSPAGPRREFIPADAVLETT